jgi:hypothetical protein
MIQDIISKDPVGRIQFIEYYGPYQTSKNFPLHKDKILKFMKLIEKKKVFEAKHPSGLRVFVADIRQ